MTSAAGQPDREASGFVLAGGQSSRMGADKAWVLFQGRPLIEHAVGILSAAGLPVFIAGARRDAAARLNSYAPVIPDVEPGLGPLGGICAALASCAADDAVFLPVDAPLLPLSLIVYLLRHARTAGSAVTLASLNSVPQTFPAVLARRALPALRKELHNRRLGCLDGFRAAARELGQELAIVPAEVLVQSGQVFHPHALPVLRWFLNINAEPDLSLASSLRLPRVI